MEYPIYPHIDTLWKRSEAGKIVVGEFTCPEFEYLQNLDWVGTEKVDGTNIRLCVGPADDRELGLRGRSNNANLPGRIVEWFEKEIVPQSERFWEQFSDGAVLYGEGYGAGIQKAGKLYLPDRVGFVLFDIRVGDWWLKREDVVEIGQHFGLDVVPVVGVRPLMDHVRTVAAGFLSHWGNFPAEGLVIQPLVPLASRNGGRIITKIKTVDYAK